MNIKHSKGRELVCQLGHIVFDELCYDTGREFSRHQGLKAAKQTGHNGIMTGDRKRVVMGQSFWHEEEEVTNESRGV